MIRRLIPFLIAVMFLALHISLADSLHHAADKVNISQNQSPPASPHFDSMIGSQHSLIPRLRRKLTAYDDDATDSDERNALQKVLEFGLLILAIGAILFVILSISVMYKRIGFSPGEYEGAERWDALDDQTLYSVKTEQMPFNQQANISNSSPNNNINPFKQPIPDTVDNSRYTHVGDAVGITKR